MSRLCVYASAVVTMFAGAGVAPSQDAARAVLTRAVQAHGGQAAITKYQARHVKVRGVLTANGNLPFTHELHFQVPGRLRDVLSVEAEGKRTTISYGLNGDTGWIVIDGKAKALPDAMLVELRESANLSRLAGLHGVLAPETQATSLPDSDVGGRPALGVRLTVKGYREVQLFFDKETGLLVKAEHPVLDSVARKMVQEERLYSGWKDVNGIRTPTHVEILRDGKKFMQADATEIEVLERLDDALFTRP